MPQMSRISISRKGDDLKSIGMENDKGRAKRTMENSFEKKLGCFYQVW